MRTAFAIFAITFLIVAVLVGPFREYHQKEDEANATAQIADSLSLSNSFLSGQIEGGKITVQTLQKQIEDNKRDNETVLLNLKTDLNEANRQRDAALQRLDFFEANPERLSNVYSNIFAHTPTNFEQFADALNTLNAGEFPKPANLELWFNGEKNLIPTEAVPGQPVELLNRIALTNRNIRISLYNISKFPAVNAYVGFQSPIEATNLIAEGWKLEPNGSVSTSNFRYDVTGSIPKYGNWNISTLKISTNFTARSFNVQIDTGADNSADKTYVINISMPTQ